MEQQHHQRRLLRLEVLLLKNLPLRLAYPQKLRVQPELKLPTVLTIHEVQILLKLIEKPSMLCFITVVYSLGLRLQEALHLQVSDIDSKRMVVHIHRGKGARDRLVPLPMSTLTALRLYYATHRNPIWIFPSESKDHTKAPTAEVPMSKSSVQGSPRAQPSS